jgi:hypothetical protein
VDILVWTIAHGDRRYVVARIRTLCAEDDGFQITGCDWK